jgi:DNA-directed RNA polymerase specialized sigma24 family protein
MKSEQYDAIAALIRMGASASSQAARLVLVDGVSRETAASTFGVTLQAVSNAIGRIRRALDLARIAAGVADGGDGASR